MLQGNTKSMDAMCIPHHLIAFYLLQNNTCKSERKRIQNDYMDFTTEREGK